jgi:low temperature requirement protein LtrA
LPQVVARARIRTGERVSPLELFFDLVFVFAITQVTALMSASPTGEGLAQGLLVLAVVWWTWTGYAWLTNTMDPEDGLVRLAMFGAMGGMLLVSLAVPHAFGDDAVLFAVAYLVVRTAHLVLYSLADRGDLELRHAIGTLVPGTLVGTSLLLLAATQDGRRQGACWALAILLDYAGPLVLGVRGWHMAAGHFAERHALVMIIALGESIVALGIGAEGVPLGAGVLAAALLGVAVSCALWWAYFDVVALVAERRLREATGEAQLRLARDSYSYLHLPMIAGVVLFALGAKKTLGHVDEPLELVPALGLCGGVAVYLLAHVAFRLRNVGTLNRQRVAAAVLLGALVPVSRELELAALATLALVAVLVATLIAYEAIRFAETRAGVRAAEAAHPPSPPAVP